MGDGWTSPLYQNGVWGDVGESFGLLGQAQRAAVEAQYAECRAEIRAGHYLASLRVCYSSLLAEVVRYGGGVNVYDVRMGSRSHDFSRLSAFLNDEAVQAAIGVAPNSTWRMENDAVEGALQGEYSRDVTPLVAELPASQAEVAVARSARAQVRPHLVDGAALAAPLFRRVLHHRHLLLLITSCNDSRRTRASSRDLLASLLVGRRRSNRRRRWRRSAHGGLARRRR